jgi:hypothetical protein
VVRFFDAGVGEATWITTPDPDPSRRQTILIDCGPPTFGAQLALRLKAAGVRHIDALLLSGTHPELIGGCPDVLKRLTVGALYSVAPGDASTPAWTSLTDAVQATYAPQPTLLSAPQYLRWGDAQAHVLNPDPSFASNSVDERLVLELNFFGWGVLLAGVIDAPGELNAVTRSLTTSSVQVLKLSDDATAPALNDDVSAAVSMSPLHFGILTNSDVDEQPRTNPDGVKRLSERLSLAQTARLGNVTLLVDPHSGPRFLSERQDGTAS